MEKRWKAEGSRRYIFYYLAMFLCFFGTALLSKLYLLQNEEKAWAVMMPWILVCYLVFPGIMLVAGLASRLIRMPVIIIIGNGLLLLAGCFVCAICIFPADIFYGRSGQLLYGAYYLELEFAYFLSVFVMEAIIRLVKKLRQV